VVELNQINESKHIVLIADNETFSLANALYSYVLSLHKKVSLVMNENIDKKFAFLPWFDKVRKEIPSSSDLEIKVTLDTLDLFEAFYDRSIKINTKMATSLYSSFLIEDEVQNVLCNDKALAAMSELILLGADCKVCYQALRESKSLALYRLKAQMFSNFILKEEATLAEVYVDQQILKQSGTDLEDALLIAQELLEIAHVNKVVLVEQQERKILKEIKVEN
jgi:bifunctional oligoribonuclease and PAP phosphatase NrnA